MNNVFGKFLTGLIAIVLLAGCTADQYSIEKQYWQVKKLENTIFANPEASPPNQVGKVIQAVNKFIEKYPKNRLAIDAEFDIAALYFAKRDFVSAREQLRAITAKYKQSEPIRSEAIFLIGNSYQLEDKWDSALLEYKKLIQEYPLTAKGLDTPVYIAQYYNLNHQPEKMVSAYQEAIAHYGQLAAKYPNTQFNFYMKNLIANCYVAIKDWQNAISTYNSMIETYKDKVNVDGLLMNKALIYSRQLKDNAKARETLIQLVKEYPKSKLAGSANKMLKELDKK